MINFDEVTLEQFETLCIEHDWTYQYADDHRAWQRGSAEDDYLRKILMFQKDTGFSQVYEHFKWMYLGEAA